MFGRYRRLVPKEHRDLIKRHRLSKPNWYVGSAEGSARLDREALEAIRAIKAELREREERRQA